MSRKAQGSEAARLSSYTYNTTMLKKHSSHMLQYKTAKTSLN